MSPEVAHIPAPSQRGGTSAAFDVTVAAHADFDRPRLEPARPKYSPLPPLLWSWLALEGGLARPLMRVELQLPLP